MPKFVRKNTDLDETTTPLTTPGDGRLHDIILDTNRLACKASIVCGIGSPCS